MSQSLDRPANMLNDLSSSQQHQKSLSFSGLQHSSDTGTFSKPFHDVQTKENRNENCRTNFDYEKKRIPEDVLVSMVAGGMAGAVAKTTIAPLDRTKINFQITNRRFSFRHAFSFIANSYRNEGFLSLWRGNSATMARIIPYAAVQFTAHEQYKKLFGLDDDSIKHPYYKRYIAGSLAGVTSQFVTYPLDLARARMAITHRDTYSNLSQVFFKMVKNDGALKLYRGLSPTMIGVVIYAGASFGTYETFKARHKESGKVDVHPLERFAYGSVAGVVSQTSSYPMDIVRRRMQTASLTGNCPDYRSTLGTIRKVCREEGFFRGLYKGLSLNWIKGPVSVGISFTVFDTFKEFAEKVIH